MFIASPSTNTPGVFCAVEGRKELGMLRSLPASMAFLREGRTQAGTEFMATVDMWFFTPPTLGDAEGRFSGMSIRMRVSCVPIW